MNVNMTAALTTEAEAPVSRENSQRQERMRKTCKVLELLINGNLRKIAVSKT
jgi:hypothetical protein